MRVIGFTNLPARLPTTSSNLFANNAAKFLLSAGPTTNKALKGSFFVDYNDPAVRGMLVVDKGETRWPNPRPYSPPVVGTNPSIASATVALQPTASASPEAVLQKQFQSNANLVSLAVIACLLAGASSQSSTSSSLMAIFLLSSYAGQNAVWNVKPGRVCS